MMTDINRYLDFVLKLFLLSATFEIPIATIILAGREQSPRLHQKKDPMLLLVASFLVCFSSARRHIASFAGNTNVVLV